MNHSNFNQVGQRIVGKGKKQRGMSIIEMTIVLAIAAIFIVGVFAVASSQMQSAKLSNDVKAIMNVKNKTTGAFASAPSYAGVDSWWTTQRAAMGFPKGSGSTGSLNVGGSITIPSSATSTYQIQLSALTGNSPSSDCMDLVNQLAGAGFTDIQVGSTPATVISGGSVSQATLATNCAQANTRIYLISA